MHATAPSGPRSIFTPSASRTSAAPHLPEAARFPCLATFAPAAAATMLATVEMLNGSTREPQPCMPQRHDDAVVAPRRDGEVGGKRRLVDHQRVVTRRLGGVRNTGEDAFAVVTHERGLAVARLWRPHHPGAERDRGALQAQAHAARRDPASGRLAHELSGAPAAARSPPS